MSSVRILLFSVLKERVGASGFDLPINAECTVSAVEALVLDRYPSLQPYAGVWRVAVNQNYADGSAVVRPGDELALITPVSGG